MPKKRNTNRVRTAGGNAKRTKRKSAKQSSNSRSGPEQSSGAHKPNGIVFEAVGLVVVGFSVFAILSVYSHTTGKKALVGKLGAAFAKWLFANLGAGSFVAAGAILIFGLFLFFRTSSGRKVWMTLGLGGAVASASLLAELYTGRGGAFGKALGNWLRSVSGVAGAYIVAVVVLLFSLYLVSGLSALRVLEAFTRLVWRVSSWIARRAAGKARRSLEAMREAATEYTSINGNQSESADSEPTTQSRKRLKTPKTQTQDPEKDSKRKRTKRKPESKPEDSTPIQSPTADTIEPEDLKRLPNEPVLIKSNEEEASPIPIPEESEEDWLRRQEDEALKRAAEQLTAELAAQEAITVESDPSTETEPSSTEPVPISDTVERIKQRARHKKQEPAEPVIKEHRVDDFDPNAQRGALEEESKEKPYELPPVDLLDYVPQDHNQQDPKELKENARHLEETLRDYGIEGRVIEIHPGPLITMYEFKPQRGIKISKIAALQDDLAMALEAYSVRIIAPIPGKSVIGIEVPNRKRQTVYLKEIIAHPVFRNSTGKLTLAMGKDIFGYPVVAHLEKMPHLLIAGTTGSGKSVALNAMILSLLYRHTPDELKFLLIDPKRLEFSFYEDIPHLLLPVVTDPKKAVAALRWVVGEMEQRYKMMKDFGVKHIESFNRKVERELKNQEATKSQPSKIVIEIEDKEPPSSNSQSEPPVPLEKLPYIVVVIDELADLMMVVGKDAEVAIARLAQLARAAGIHLIIATQRPSTDVITGLIKNNFPCRISFKVGDKVSSRVVIDTNGAEALLGVGDMLFLSPSVRGGLQRLHAPFVSEEEIDRVVKFIRAQGEPNYAVDLESLSYGKDDEDESWALPASREDVDELYDVAVQIVCETKQASASYLQRRLKIGYNRAARLIEQMEKDGIVGPPEGSKPRKVYGRPIRPDGLEEI